MGHVSINSDGRITLHLANGRNGTSRNPAQGTKYIVKRFRKTGTEGGFKSLLTATGWMNRHSELGNFDVYKVGPGPVSSMAATSLYGVYNSREQRWLEKQNASASRRSNPANIAKASANIARYVVYVGDKAAWVGKLKSKANAAATDLMDRGRAGVKIYQAKVTNAVRDGWRQAFVN